jgi:hypothetical protein
MQNPSLVFDLFFKKCNQIFPSFRYTYVANERGFPQ